MRLKYEWDNLMTSDQFIYFILLKHQKMYEIEYILDIDVIQHIHIICMVKMYLKLKCVQM